MIRKILFVFLVRRGENPCSFPQKLVFQKEKSDMVILPKDTLYRPDGRPLYEGKVVNYFYDERKNVFTTIVENDHVHTVNDEILIMDFMAKAGWVVVGED